VRPCRILDPFIGSGTTCIASLRLGRWSWGVDLSEPYLREHAVKRVGERLVELNGPGELVGFNSAPVTW
jgi:DNA modification methylase